MKKAMILSTALVGLVAGAAQAEEVTVLSWGGAYEKSQVEAYNKPFAEATGIDVNMEAADNPATPIKAQVEANNVSVDVADVEKSDAIRLCDEGLLEPIDPDTDLAASPDGTPASEDFIDGSFTDCGVANIVWSTVMSYNADKVDGTPSSIADFFDTEKFPGKRGLRKSAKGTLEFALMGAGVPAADVYKELGTPEGVDKAFAELDKIKGDVVWWDAGAQPPQLLADGEVVMSTAYNGRIFNAEVAEGQPFKIVWDGQLMDFDFFVIPKGAPHMEAAKKYLKFATETQQLANQAKWISYGPARKSSAPMVGMYQDGKTEMGPHMPTAENNMQNALVNDSEFWADHDTELSERFNAWLAG
ncbi:ABC transporter substrate-binding protein [Thioclava electrotropha]|uniref:ABC transporter substrate-binding protein n=1 Tax=Thioclava electrotropha TaxID=1549850 RepID=A0ABX6YRJ4_9RHOB|nr:ABC transporter substrate-binding protein [Thioclava electrotropha]QPZ90355.1 ABC transporter substrate-binding protein [Thioclava electrotropha]